MYSSSVTSSTISSVTSSRVPYDQLNSLWRIWIEQTQWPPMDKWLKNYFREQFQDSRAGHKSYQKPATPKDRLNAKQSVLATDNASLGLWMLSAMRFAQLACAMETAYIKGADIDWNLWDKEWQTKDVKKLSPPEFWFWVVLREQGVTAELPRALRDSEARRDWFEKNRSEWLLNPAQHLLWNGLKPQFLQVLEERKLKSSWGTKDFQKFIGLQNTPPPLWLRSQKNISSEDLLKKLSAESVIVDISPDNNLFASGGRFLFATDTFKEGFVEVQDLASQQIALAVAVKPGEKVWDACAGAGGKSLAISARMNNKGSIFATDLHAHKLEELKRRATRADLHNIRCFEWQGDAPLRLPKEVAQQKGFDWVLVDAPCTASGTWRRNPDARWRFNTTDTQELVELQQKILTNAAPAVKAQGHLVYATCSFQVSENEGQVEWFLQTHSDFELVEQKILGSPAQNSDTMFVAVMKRINSNPSQL